MADLHEKLLALHRPKLTGIKRQIMRKMCRLADSKGNVHITAREILKDVRGIQAIKYGFWTELIRKDKLISNVVDNWEDSGQWTGEGVKVFYRVQFAEFTGTNETNRHTMFRHKLVRATDCFKEVLKQATSDPALTHVSKDELLFRCAYVARAGIKACHYRKDAAYAHIEVLQTMPEVPEPVESDSEGLPGQS